MNLQQINSAVPSGAQMHYIWVARLVASLETVGSHLSYINIYTYISFLASRAITLLNNS